MRLPHRCMCVHPCPVGSGGVFYLKWGGYILSLIHVFFAYFCVFLRIFAYFLLGVVFSYLFVSSRILTYFYVFTKIRFDTLRYAQIRRISEDTSARRKGKGAKRKPTGDEEAVQAAPKAAKGGKHGKKRAR
jgi:hypothetical protein